MQYFTGENIANNLTALGFPSSFINLNIAPQLITYHFNILDFNKYSRLKQTVQKLNAIYHTIFNLIASTIGHFALQWIRPQKQLIETTQLGNTMAELPPNSILFGFNDNNTAVASTLQDLPHLLIAGTTGSGKSVALNSYIINLCCFNTPQELGIILIDLKQCEFNIYDNLPHLLCKVVRDEKTAEYTLKAIVNEMEHRYKVMADHNTDTNNGLFKTWCVVVDELSDLILQNDNCKTLLIKLLQKSRACDIHIIVATQSPRAKILDGLMLANLPSRICLTCSNFRESMLVIGHGGAEKLTGNGDAIIKLNGTIQEQRIQIPFISKQQVLNLINKKG